MSLQEKLLGWFQIHERPLPWRRIYDPYEVWISEIMLQQTQVSTVIPYFERWMQTLPTLQAVASAPEGQILKLWEGLGYYSRALNLQKAAQKIVAEHGGEFPRRYEDILALPGIGPYTAGAISSIAFQEDRPLVDGNVVRVLARLFDFRENVKEHMDFFWERAEALLPPGRARDFNQGLMELGALVCTPRNPRCSTCPLREDCRALASKTVDFLPFKGPAPTKIPIRVAIGILEKEGTVYVQKRAGTGLMAGLWEFPGGKVEGSETLEETLRREVFEETGLPIDEIRPLLSLKHAYTKYLVDLHAFVAKAGPGEVKLSSASEYRWIRPAELHSLPFPAANLKIIEKYLK